ncbi:serine/threonine-protein kinase [Nocardioides sp. CFH 31398]|uniref:serine/threonine-protein kinase n=1 Tax=Nocardioides sp. CFH 31398 TaxID=2919579 RepID=UPI001F068ACE|nr:serine/threonine-protein kinase [Nocardioides sp. CFH 31398]MCH1869030.1 serine/threonine protein kinase [Nocardioides sp. CFH 31398]
MSAATQEPDDRWRFRDGDAITDELTATRLLGGGSAYEAYLAFDEITFSPVVVKVVRPDQVDSRSALRGLRREVEALATINHPVVVRGLRHALEGPRPHVVLEAVDGPRLSSLVRRYGPLEDYQYLALAIDVASSLHYLRGLGWVHLDIKPSNIIMGSPARLIDLSVARPVADAAALDHVIGTDAYMAPEQCDPPSTGSPGPASDVWGLGATLFHAVAGHRPFADGDPDARDLGARFPQVEAAPARLPRDVDPRVADTIHAMLDADPSSRPEPREVAEALEPVLAALPRQRLAGFKVR